MFTKKRKSPLPSLLPEAEFIKLLDRERLRTERSGRSFCLLHIGEDAAFEQLESVVARIHSRTMRGTDAAGTFREGVGVLLPETELAGARRVARELLRQSSLKCQIYVFPFEETPEVDEPQRRGLDERSHDNDSNDNDSNDNHSNNDDSNNERNLSRQPAGASFGGAFSAESPEAMPLETLMTIHTPLWKRSLDVAGAAVGLTVLGPLLLLAAAAIKLTSRGPILFTQVRAGQGGRPFKIYKFRSMRVGAELEQAQLRAQSEQDGPAFKLKKDPRVTWIGRYLRKSCVDELPQLWNVLRGEMSLVGPRPLPISESAGVAPWQRRRLMVKPGLTCIWQVEGGSKVKFQDWMRMDIRYINDRGPWRDLGLILRTALNVVLHRASH